MLRGSEWGGGGGELENDEHRNYGDAKTRNAVTNIATCEPCNFRTTLPRVTGRQSVVDKAQKHMFVKVSSCCIWIVVLDQSLIKASTSLSHQV